VIVTGPDTVIGDAGPETPVNTNVLPGVVLETLLYEDSTVPPLSIKILYGNPLNVTGTPLTVATVPEADESRPE
jgi:hypothetical protein